MKNSEFILHKIAVNNFRRSEHIYLYRRFECSEFLVYNHTNQIKHGVNCFYCMYLGQPVIKSKISQYLYMKIMTSSFCFI